MAADIESEFNHLLPEGLAQLSGSLVLSLDVREMMEIQDYFKKLGRNPTRAELEMLAQTWSEHCKHKTFNAVIECSDSEGNLTTINGLFSTYIKKATVDVGAALGDRGEEWLVSVFKDNAGIVKFNDNFDFAFKAETHNHPSALDPFGGANTGVGGVIRDILGAGMGARPCFNTDAFCLAPPDFPKDRVPAGILAPKRILRGVVAGVRDYGNPMGIPTVNGAFFFHDSFLGSPLVFCGTGGFIPRGMHEKKALPQDAIIVVGGSTGRDGIHGATFSSIELSGNSSSGAVQIGNPIEERKVMDALLAARDRGLYRAVTDCGAGGFSSAIGEMAQDTGCEVWLDRAPLKHQSLQQWEIWLSESQERMIFAVPDGNVAELVEVFRREGVAATAIGKFTGSGRVVVKFGQDTICDLDCDFLHKGLPQKKLKAKITKIDSAVSREFSQPSDLAAELAALLSSWNVCSKEWVVRQYDHEVQAHTVIKPLHGRLMDGHGDAAVLQPFFDSFEGIAIGNGLNPLYGTLNPYAMAASAIDEALRNVVSVGGDPFETVLLDNFCLASPNDERNLGDLVEACRACYDYSVAFGAPFISGKDSLFNEYKLSGRSIPIPPTLLVSAASKVHDVRKCVTSDFKAVGNLVYLAGTTKDELGGSQYYYTKGMAGGNVPKVDAAISKKILKAASDSIRGGLVLSCHDCSEGGLGVAVSEMCFGSGMGAQLELASTGYSGSRDDYALFSESSSRLVIEVAPENAGKTESMFEGLPFHRIGRTGGGSLTITGLDGKTIIDTTVETLKSAWKNPMGW